MLKINDEYCKKYGIIGMSCNPITDNMSIINICFDDSKISLTIDKDEDFDKKVNEYVIEYFTKYRRKKIEKLKNKLK